MASNVSAVWGVPSMECATLKLFNFISHMCHVLCSACFVQSMKGQPYGKISQSVIGKRISLHFLAFIQTQKSVIFQHGNVHHTLIVKLQLLIWETWNFTTLSSKPCYRASLDNQISTKIFDERSQSQGDCNSWNNYWSTHTIEHTKWTSEDYVFLWENDVKQNCVPYW